MLAEQLVLVIKLGAALSIDLRALFLSIELGAALLEASNLVYPFESSLVIGDSLSIGSC